MKLAIVVLAFAAVAFATEREGRIIGGEVTTIDQYPSIVSLEVSSLIWSFTCGGSIINNRYILTAAHCTQRDASLTRVRAGSSYRLTGGVVYYAASIINHPSYNSWTIDSDISLIGLLSTITYTNVIQSTSIPTPGYEIPTNTQIIIVGWGSTELGVGSQVLRHVTVDAIDYDECKRRYDTRPVWSQGVVTENMFCAGILDMGGKDACSGDSGGPVYYDNVQCGLVSWGEGCADSFFPGIKTKVSAFTDWIVSNAV